MLEILSKILPNFSLAQMSSFSHLPKRNTSIVVKDGDGRCLCNLHHFAQRKQQGLGTFRLQLKPKSVEYCQFNSYLRVHCTLHIQK